MQYLIRAFCLEKQVPSLASLLQWLEQRQVRVQLHDGKVGVAPDSPEWQEVSLDYAPGKQPFVLRCLRNEGEDSPAHKEVEGFLEKIGPAGKSTIKRRVIAHLKGTRYIIACELPVWEMDDAAWDANGQILTFLVENAHALIHADKEGFYERSNLILKVP